MKFWFPGLYYIFPQEKINIYIFFFVVVYFVQKNACFIFFFIPPKQMKLMMPLV